jgi:hypothetical protein
MRAKGISYDTGFINKGRNARQHFDSEVVRRELRIIRDDLHCNAVRVIGSDPDRLETAAAHAADLGLEVWFSPFVCDLTADELLALLADCAERAERLRRRGAEVVLVAGGEISLLNRGFLPGDTIDERLGLLADRDRLRELIRGLPARVNDFLAKAVAVVRGRFGGKVTYAAIPLENVDWAPFDLISVDLYRSAEDGDYVRDEEAQARYLHELLDVFDAEGVDSAFVYTFANFDGPHRGDPREDLDLASYGIVKVLEDRRGDTYPDMAREPKVAFTALAEHYRG